MVMICPNRDTGLLNIRVATYDLETENPNLTHDETI